MAFHATPEQVREWIRLLNGIFGLGIGVAGCAAEAARYERMFGSDRGDADGMIFDLSLEAASALRSVDPKRAARKAAPRHTSREYEEAAQVLELCAERSFPGDGRRERLLAAAKALRDKTGQLEQGM